MLVALVGAGFLIGMMQGNAPATQLAADQLRAPPTQFTVIRVLTPTGWINVQPDASIEIDVNAAPPVIRAVAPATQDLVEKFVVTTAATTFTLAAIPGKGCVPQVARNGVLMTEGIDYTVAGATVSFLPVQPVLAGDIVQIRYRR
jgi:hypothetical protein